MELRHHLMEKLKQMRLSGMQHTLDDRLTQAHTEQWSYQELLERLLEDEVEHRAQQQLARRVKRSGVASAKTLVSFDFTANASINRQQVRELARCDYVRQKRNLLICGPTGVGKSHLAHALAHEACLHGFEVLVTDTHKLLQHLHGGRADGSWVQRLQRYLRPHLLVLDEFGLKPLTPPMPQDLYDVISERYERGSILVTSNRAPSEWPTLFGDPLLASAGLDRLGDRAEVIVITGQSFRARPHPTWDGSKVVTAQPKPRSGGRTAAPSEATT